MRYRSEESETSVNKCKSDLCVLPCVDLFPELISPVGLLRLQMKS